MLDLFTGRHDLSAAAGAADLKVHTHSRDDKSVVTAGMRLFHDKLVVDLYIHKLPLVRSHNNGDYITYL